MSSDPVTTITLNQPDSASAPATVSPTPTPTATTPTAPPSTVPEPPIVSRAGWGAAAPVPPEPLTIRVASASP